MMEIPHITPERATKVIDWWWQHGRVREKDYKLDQGDWLYRLYSIAGLSEKVAGSIQREKAALALWGPSQTGKSTFLSRYLDNKDPRGVGSPLDWGDPVRFTVGEEKENVVVFNPYNQGSDASGCISRFVLASPNDGKVDHQHPIQIRFSTPKQLIHALATGYLSECETEFDGKTVIWDIESIEGLLDSYQGEAEPDREAYSLLVDLVDVLNVLRRSSLPRYSNLNQRQEGVLLLDRLRVGILNNPLLSGNYTKAREFAATLLWDGILSFPETFQLWVDYGKDLNRLGGGGDVRVSCSFKVAALLLDIASYQNYVGGVPSTKSLVESLTYTKGGAGLIVSEGEGPRLFKTGEEFALLQGVVWELIVPIRKDRLGPDAEKLVSLLEIADIVDFPGVSNEFKAAADELLDESKLKSQEHSFKMYTQVLKRGKTSSIVASSGDNLDIDGFSILARIMRFPGNPQQLWSGIDAWWSSYTGESLNLARSKDLPLNLLITFMGKLASDLVTSGIDALGNTLDPLKKMGKLSDPKVVSTFVTTYSQFPDGQIRNNARDALATEPEKQDAFQRFSSDLAYRQQLIDGNFTMVGEDSNSSLKQMMFEPDGGVGYVIEKMIHDATNSPRRNRVAEREKEANRVWKNLLFRAVPGDGDEQEEKSRRIRNWIAGLDKIMEDRQAANRMEDASQKLSYDLRHFLDVDAETLEELPTNLAAKRAFDIREFIENQLALWKHDVGSLNLKGFGFESEPDALFIRGYLVDAVLQRNESAHNDRTTESIDQWLSRNFSDVPSFTEAKESRNFLALKLSNELSGRALLQMLPRPLDETLVNQLFYAAAAPPGSRVNFRDSPHYTQLILPFLNYLETVRTVTTSGRAEQSGDSELVNLLLG